MKFVITIPTFNAGNLILRSVHSALSQEYPDFRVLVVNDASVDDTTDILNRFVERDKLSIIHNENRVGILANHYKMGHLCHEDEIIVNLDGDDQLAHPFVLNKLAEVYADANVWMTYGSFAYDFFSRNPNGDARGFASQVSPMQHNRNSPFSSSHLRTYKAWLFQRILVEDLFDEDGDFYQWSMDHALMFPMIEMAGPEHARYIHDILYLYNASHPLNEHALKDRDSILEVAKRIYAKRIYPKLTVEKEYPQWIY